MNKKMVLVMFIFISGYANAQKVLNKQEVSSKLENLQLIVDSKDYEKALKIFYSENEVITIEKVKNKDKELYSNIETVLQSKRKLFNDNANRIREWELKYSQEEYESLFEIININFNESYKSDIVKFDALISKIKPIKIAYDEIKENTVIKPGLFLSSINMDSVTYTQSLKDIKTIETFELDIKENKAKLKGKNPKLLSEINIVSNNLNNKKEDLVKFSVVNKPLTPKEVNSIVFSNDKISIDFVMHNCYYIPNKDCYAPETYNPTYIYNYNVFDMYPELKEKSNLQKEAYKSTDDYNLKFNILKKKRNKMINASYISMNPFKKTEYNLQEKAFEIHVAYIKAYEYYIDITPPKCLHYVEFLQLNYKGGATKQSLVLKVPPENALKIENNKNNVELLILFDITGKYTKKYRFTGTWSKKTADLEDEVFKTKNVRILIYNTITKEIYFDKIYI